jgi:O-methyltransferase
MALLTAQWLAASVLLIAHQSYSVSSQILPIEVELDESLLSFEADLSLPDFGAGQWCMNHNVYTSDCIQALSSSVPRSITARSKNPQSLIDGTASSELHSMFDDPNACTDNYHVRGRCLLLHTLFSYVVNGNVPGDYVEAGVHIGDSAAAISQVLLSLNSKKTMYLYDSFIGMPEASLDIDGSYATELSPSHDEQGRGWGHEASAEGVFNRLSTLGVNKNQIVIRQGWFNETFNTSPRPSHHVAFLMVDGDWYQSVLDTLNTFYDQVPVGGIIVLDDYGYWEGARKALGSFLRSRPDIEMPLFERYGPDILWWVKGNQNNRPS